MSRRQAVHVRRLERGLWRDRRRVRPSTSGSKSEPLSPYAAGKLAGEHYVSVYAKTMGLDGVSLRYFNIFGPRRESVEPLQRGDLSSSCAMSEGRRPTIFGDGPPPSSADEELRAVLAHEQEHRRMRDPLRLAIGRILCEALFFLPVRAAARPLRRGRRAHRRCRRVAAAAAASSAGGRVAHLRCAHAGGESASRRIVWTRCSTSRGRGSCRGRCWPARSSPWRCCWWSSRASAGARARDTADSALDAEKRTGEAGTHAGQGAGSGLDRLVALVDDGTDFEITCYRWSSA